MTIFDQSLGELRQLALHLVADKKSDIDVMARLRAFTTDAELQIRDSELKQLVADAEREHLGLTNGVSLGDVIEIPDDDWIIEQLISAGKLNLIVALQKVGKSALICNALGELAKGRGEYLDRFRLAGHCPPIILVGSDQWDSNWKKLLIPNGLMECLGGKKYRLKHPLVKFWHKANPVFLDDNGIDRITAAAEQFPGAIIVLDSFRELITPLGLDENSNTASNPVRRLLAAVAPYRCTTVLLHHSAKSRANERASNAGSGSPALASVANHIVNLHWLNPDIKSDERVKFSTEGREDKGCNLVIKQYERGLFQLLGTAEEFEQQLQRQSAESKLTDRQAMVLTFLRGRRGECQEPVDTTAVAESLADAFGANPRQKALQALEGLARKGLIAKTVQTNAESGKVASWYPIDT